MRKCANVHLEAAGLQRQSLLGDIWQPKRQLCANLANRKQDFQNSEQVFSMQIFGADKKSFFILDFKRFWLLIFRNMLRGGTSSTSFKIYELAKLKRYGKVLGQNNLCSSSIKDWAQTHFQKYPHQPWNQSSEDTSETNHKKAFGRIFQSASLVNK